MISKTWARAGMNSRVLSVPSPDCCSDQTCHTWSTYINLDTPAFFSVKYAVSDKSQNSGQEAGIIEQRFLKRNSIADRENGIVRNSFCGKNIIWNFGCPSLWSVQSNDGWGPGQLGLVKGVPGHGLEVKTGWSLRSLPTQTVLWF